MDAIPDDTLELILLHLDSQVSLLRAASTCKRWRLIVACDVFLRRFGSLHKLPVVAGSYHNSFPRLVRPHFKPASSRHTDVDSGYFSLDFLPESNTRTWWSMMDSRGSLLLLFRREGGDRGSRDFIICEPLTRRHRIIPAPAAASPRYISPQAFLLDGDEGSEPAGSRCIGMSNLRVLCFVSDADFCSLDVFTTTGGSWRAINISRPEWYHFIGFGSRSLYWLAGDHTVFSVDDQATTTESSAFLLPEPVVEDWDPFDAMKRLEITVAVGSDGEARIVLGDGEEPEILKVFARLPAAGGEWALEKSIELTAAMLNVPRLFGWSFMHGVRGVQSTRTVLINIYPAERWLLPKFSIDIETMEVERLPDTYMERAYPTKLPWPPSLHACTYHA